MNSPFANPRLAVHNDDINLCVQCIDEWLARLAPLLRKHRLIPSEIATLESAAIRINAILEQAHEPETA